MCQTASLWGTLSHENIMPLFGICEAVDTGRMRFWFVTPYMKHGTLRQWRKKINPAGVEIRDRVRLISNPHS